MSELERIRANGYALIDQEVELGLRSIAIPVYNARAATVAAMNIRLAATQDSVERLCSSICRQCGVFSRSCVPYCDKAKHQDEAVQDDRFANAFIG